LVAQFYRNIDCAILCFDVTKKKSFDKLPMLFEKLNGKKQNKHELKKHKHTFSSQTNIKNINKQNQK